MEYTSESVNLEKTSDSGHSCLKRLPALRSTPTRYELRRVGIPILFLLLSTSGIAQVFYHKSNDEVAQKALQLSKDASLASSLDPALRNLDTLEDHEANIEFDNIARVARSAIDSTRCWGQIIYAVCSLKTTKPLPGSICTLIEGKIANPQECTFEEDRIAGFRYPVPTTKQLQERQEQLQKELDALKQKSDDAQKELSSLDEAAAVAKQVVDFSDKASALLKDKSFVSSHKNEFQAAKDGLSLLSDDLTSLAAVEKKRKDMLQKLQGLSDPLASLESDRLRAQMDHVEALLRIARLKDQEEDYLQAKIIGTFEQNLQSLSTRPSDLIETSFAVCAINTAGACNRERLSNLGEALELYASALVWAAATQRLNELRTARENHRYSIQTSIVEAKAADLVISTGVQRLALYHQGGIKAEALAQLLAQVTSAAATVRLAIE